LNRNKQSNIFWFTGLSGAGKTTIATTLYNFLVNKGYGVKILDGDEIRKEIHFDLGFSKKDIEKNNLKIAELCISLMSAYEIILVPIISPFISVRKKVKKMIGAGFNEIYIDIPLSSAINRDVKGLYKKALKGQIDNFIGIDPSIPYEPPTKPDLVISTDKESISSSVEKLFDYILVKVKKNG
tara:strand:+ start:58105 stop:58653 length:549 start_codon:yes stop_codon:yes gene_type:complete